MKIERGYQKYQQNEFAQANRSSKATQPGAYRQTENKNVNYDLSETTKNLQKTAKTLEQSPINTEKVAALKAAIKNGSYQVDAAALAKKMLAADE